MSTFNELVNQIDNYITNQRDRGTAFEKLAVAYLKNEPAFKNKYSDVWMLNEVPAEYNISKQDTGVDIVAKDRITGKLTAVQAKYYKGKVGKDTINSFIAESSKDYYADGMIISSTDDWNKNAKKATEELSKDISIIGLSQLQNANFDWQLFDFDSQDKNLGRKPKELRDYQKEAIQKSLAYFKENTRGKLVMAPGTGKTFTSLKIAEALMNETGNNNFNVLYLVPSIQLLSQTLFNWNSDKSDDISMVSFSVVSDKKATKKKTGEDDLSAKDVGFPATTNVDELMANYANVQKQSEKNMTVVFSTYQSIDVISKAQKQGYSEFDLIVADEAHRTTGASQMGDASVFTKVHDNSIVKGKLRLYQTATPKVYGPEAKKKADDNSMVISSMDDEAKYGTEIFRLGFGDAVSRGYLTDYKVSVLAVSENYINKNMQSVMASNTSELDTNDIGKIIGVWNAMVKRNGITGEITGAPMKRAIAFTDTIAHSKQIAEEFNYVINDYLGAQAEDSFSVDVHHVDGGLNALQKKTQLDWLASDMEDNEARVLSNVRFLTEGIDVPNLDAVIFLSPKKSQVDIVQAVGRIMRKFEGKEYGYIILPVVIDTNSDPVAVLDNNDRYKEVWQVLNALRSTDERFEAEINKLELNKKKSGRINVIGTNTSPNEAVTEDNGKNIENGEGNQPVQLELDLDEMSDLEQAFYGRIVKKVGDRRYLEDWSKDVAEIAKRHITKINDLIDSREEAKTAFNIFLTSLQHNINSSVDRKQAIEMLAQHLITQPVFEVLFEGYSFVKDNPVSHAMNDVVDEFSKYGFDKEQKELAPFYKSVKLRASGIDNAEAKQKIIVTLYDKFFRTGFKKTTEQLGIVFTPVEVVDFIINSVDYALNKYFGKRLSSKNVHVLDPFTGTGTFITRTLQYLKRQMDGGEITFEDILYKYNHELHANEIILLSYYIASINIESVFDEVNGPNHGYQPFEGIVLADTFESTEREGSFVDELLGENNERLKKQQEKPITVIFGNPPYSAKQDNEDKNYSRAKYPKLDNSLKKTWIDTSSAINKNGLMDSYIKAIRWSADRLSNDGIISFITNSSYIDGVAMDGMRKSLLNEFSDIYVIDLKGQIRRRSKKQIANEGENIFDIMTGVAIILLVRDSSKSKGKGNLHYFDIGNGLTKKDKLEKLTKLGSIANIENVAELIEPNEKGDWINQRNSNFETLLKLGDKKSKDGLFIDYTGGITTGRDDWSWGFSETAVYSKINTLVNYYNEHLGDTSVYDEDNTSISWTRSLKQRFEKKEKISFKDYRIYTGMYRPFVKKHVYYSQELVDRQYRMAKVLPVSDSDNIMISLSNKTEGKDLTLLALNVLPDRNLFAGGSQNLPKYLYDGLGKYSSVRQEQLKKLVGLDEEDVLAYIYGLLSSSDYENLYALDLAKSFPRIPNVKNKKAFIDIGKKLMDLHLNYEEVPVFKGVSIEKKSNPDYRVKKMKFARVRNPETGKLENDRSTIIFNTDITIKYIPEKSYEYIVNGRSAIEWIMDQYQIKDKTKSGVIDDPNDFSDDPKYIFKLLLRIINVSVQTVDLVNSLPKLEEVE
ncbi:DEAD/DEAH box helicase [Ligilactobacillus murinus]|uniref:type ISP restriction/modification enzyme n=1 Tax=Ligilactobacillus murinus TaxID=1622 RepID=UPI00107187FA|nr:type ISP restriction/modification enzyme [Ligilactobacillus murinus]MBF0758815.1 DEAD/DEAH box helicase [Ligilactobacillus murinus]TFU63607.1 DEAD/DEAH box helicase [Ligilactobacillus murinus]